MQEGRECSLRNAKPEEMRSRRVLNCPSEPATQLLWSDDGQAASNPKVRVADQSSRNARPTCTDGEPRPGLPCLDWPFHIRECTGGLAYPEPSSGIQEWKFQRIQPNLWPQYKPSAHELSGPWSASPAEIFWRCTISRSSDTTRRQSRALFSRAGANSRR